MTVEFFKQKYGYEIEGVWVPRVTAVTSLVSRAHTFASRESADWGSLIHESIGAVLNGTPLVSDPAVAPSLEVFDKWKREREVQVLGVEQRVFHENHAYAGTADLIAKVRGRLGIVDVKTTSEIRDEHALQTAAYLYAYNSDAGKGKECSTRWILRIDQYARCEGCFAQKRETNGKGRIRGGNPLCNHFWSAPLAELEFVELKDHEEDFEAFLSAKELWEWYHRDWLRQMPNYPKKLLQKILI